MVKIDQSKSDFEKGLIVPEGKPLDVLIELKVPNDEMIGDKIWYKSKKKLKTNVSVSEFIEETSPKFRKIIVENRKIRCNGSECNHIVYCKYFRESKRQFMEEIC
jgi:hypothetical protein